jgi:hypothetical protein
LRSDQQLVQRLGWGSPFKGLAWPTIESGGNGIEVIGAVKSEIGSFGKY